MSLDRLTPSVAPHPLTGQEILFTQQHHFADRAGEHFDYRLVLGDKAYSWASRKDVPEPGKAILLFEQPIHDREYALSSEIEIPKGNYGAGKTFLKFVRKAKVDEETESDKLVFNAGNEKYLLKKLNPEKYGKEAWLFKNLSKESYNDEQHFGYTRQKLAAVSPELEAKFKPDFTPEQMKALGVLRHPGSKYNKEEDNDPTKNFFGVRASLDAWPDKWHNPEHELGWFQWMQGYMAGKRTEDDERQIKRWLSFKARHLAQLKKADPTLENDAIQPRRRQALLNWGIAAGDKNRYLRKIEGAGAK